MATSVAKFTRSYTLQFTGSVFCRLAESESRFASPYSRVTSPVVAWNRFNSVVPASPGSKVPPALAPSEPQFAGPDGPSGLGEAPVSLASRE